MRHWGQACVIAQTERAPRRGHRPYADVLFAVEGPTTVSARSRLRPGTDSVIRRAAQQLDQSPGVFVQEAVHRALTRRARRDAARLDRALQMLLARTTPARFLAAAGRTLTHTPLERDCAESD